MSCSRIAVYREIVDDSRSPQESGSCSEVDTFKMPTHKRRSPQESGSCSLTGVLRDIPQAPRRSPQESVSCSEVIGRQEQLVHVALRRRAGVVAATKRKPPGNIPSLSAGERELKPRSCCRSQGTSPVAPLAGARVEALVQGTYWIRGT